LTNHRRPLILVTNDDGVDSPGILAAVRSVVDLGELWVVAPRTQQSGLGRSFPKTFTEEYSEDRLRVNDTQVPCFAVDASPAQAVRNAIRLFLPRSPDLVISGINYGENIGGSVTISGTVGAAIEAASFGVPALAASLETAQEYHYSQSTDVDFGVAASIVRRFSRHLLARGMPAGVDILKLDVPSSAQEDTPWTITRVSRQQYFVNPVTTDEKGQRQLSKYRVAVDLDRLEPDSDVHALAVDRLISVTPLTIDMTAKVDFGYLRDALLVDQPICAGHLASASQD
jgi:5'-nucleotidase